MILAIGLIFFTAIACGLWPCRFGMHRWDEPGGHCEDCGECDEFFEPHDH